MRERYRTTSPGSQVQERRGSPRCPQMQGCVAILPCHSDRTETAFEGLPRLAKACGRTPSQGPDGPRASSAGGGGARRSGLRHGEKLGDGTFGTSPSALAGGAPNPGVHSIRDRGVAFRAPEGLQDDQGCLARNASSGTRCERKHHPWMGDWRSLTESCPWSSALRATRRTAAHLTARIRNDFMRSRGGRWTRRSSGWEHAHLMSREERRVVCDAYIPVPITADPTEL